MKTRLVENPSIPLSMLMVTSIGRDIPLEINYFMQKWRELFARKNITEKTTKW